MQYGQNFNDFATYRSRLKEQERQKSLETRHSFNTFRASDESILLEKKRLDNLKSRMGPKSAQEAKQLLHQYKAAEETIQSERKRIPSLYYKKKYVEMRSSFFLTLASSEIEERIRRNRHHLQSESSTQSIQSVTPPSSPTLEISVKQMSNTLEKNLEAVRCRLRGANDMDGSSLCRAAKEYKHLNSCPTRPCSSISISDSSARSTFHQFPIELLRTIDGEIDSESIIGSELTVYSQSRQGKLIRDARSTVRAESRGRSQNLLDEYCDEKTGMTEEDVCFACKVM
jgi:hypothetical protein